MIEKEIPLKGGNVTNVVRIGKTVRRATGIWSPSVHGLLRHLEAQGFNGAPRFLGFDNQGREILTFIEGEVGHYPLQTYMWSEEVLIETARFLRHYHDAAAGYIPSANAVWQIEYPDRSQHEVICHTDVAPYNMVFLDGKPHALIDFDTAGPGPRIWDIAYVVYRFIPLSYGLNLQHLELEDPLIQSQRLKKFCDAYGFTNSREKLLSTVIARIEALCTLVVKRAAEHNPVYQKMIEEGALDFYRRDIETMQYHRSQLEQYLSSS